MDWGKHQCSSLLTLFCDGSVMPCGQLPREFAVGNFYQQGLGNIVREHHTVIARGDLTIKGQCAICENNDICWGCRASAYHYLGDIEASDPKCWRNPAAKETYLR
jgi:radical SAM protein with 4Fe4S-binding SPASM domain